MVQVHNLALGAAVTRSTGSDGSSLGLLSYLTDGIVGSCNSQTYGDTCRGKSSGTYMTLDEQYSDTWYR